MWDRAGYRYEPARLLLRGLFLRHGPQSAKSRFALLRGKRSYRGQKPAPIGLQSYLQILEEEGSLHMPNNNLLKQGEGGLQKCI
jgi:hypothetical protein